MRPDRRAAYNRPVLLTRLRPFARRALACVALAAAALVCAEPRVAADEPWRTSADVPVHYSIKARLRPDHGPGTPMRITGDVRIAWRNTSPDDVSSLYLHLYANAFRNTRSSFLREAAASGWELPEDMQFGGIDVQRVEFLTGDVQLPLEFVQPDDGNVDDRTVARIALPAPVRPGEGVAVRMRFTTTLPSIVARMGRKDDFVMAAQWYPKLGRYVGKDSTMPNVREGWYCHQYHRNTEFYADFADYDVELDVPDGYVTGATGTRVGPRTEVRGGLRTEIWQARSVVDFAWTAHQRFLSMTRELTMFKAPAGVSPRDDPVLRERRRLAALRGIEPREIRLPKVKVTVLLQPEHERQQDRYFAAARVALGLYGLWFGPYPYEQLTIVDPAHGARAAGGMKYPQLVTVATRVASPKESLQPEGVIVHEIGHQWFMNALASNEAEEAWLDEGLTTYFTARALDTAYGPAVGVHRVLGVPLLVTPFMEFAGLGTGWPEWIGLPDWAHPPDLEILTAWRDLPPLTALPTRRYKRDPIEPRRRSYLRRAGWDEFVRPAWEYHDRRSYVVNAYSRPALFVATLRRTLHARLGAQDGERAFVLGMERYARDWRFRHPTTPDFMASFSDGSGHDIAPLAAALLRTSGVLDYAVESIETVHEPDLVGRTERDGEEIMIAAQDAERRRGEPQTAVVVRRRGEVIVPVRLQVTREDGPPDEVTWTSVEWDGRERWKRFVFEGRFVAARIHPDAEYLQDVDRRNDSMRREQNGRPGVKWGVRFLLWLENAALSYGRFL